MMNFYTADRAPRSWTTGELDQVARELASMPPGAEQVAAFMDPIAEADDPVKVSRCLRLLYVYRAPEAGREPDQDDLVLPAYAFVNGSREEPFSERHRNIIGPDVAELELSLAGLRERCQDFRARNLGMQS